MSGENSLEPGDTTKSAAAVGSTGGETPPRPVSCDVKMRGAVNTALCVKAVWSDACTVNTRCWVHLPHLVPSNGLMSICLRLSSSLIRSAAEIKSTEMCVAVSAQQSPASWSPFQSECEQSWGVKSVPAVSKSLLNIAARKLQVFTPTQPRGILQVAL